MRRLHDPPTPGLGLRTHRTVGSAAGIAAGRECIGFVRILLPNLAPGQIHPAPGKRALLTSPGPALRTFCHPLGEEGMAGSLVISEAHPRDPCSTGALVREGPHPQPQASPARVFPARPGQRVLGAPGWSWCGNPDHQARELTGASGQMLSAKPLGLQGPDRKPPSLHAASLPPLRQPPGVGDCLARGLLPEVQPSPWERSGHPSRSCPLK